VVYPRLPPIKGKPPFLTLKILVALLINYEYSAQASLIFARGSLACRLKSGEPSI
jgi:hypothetical protein